MLSRRQIIANALRLGSAAMGAALLNGCGKSEIPMRNSDPTPGRKPTGLVLDPVYWKHRPGEDHPESPERLDAVKRALQEPALAETLRSIPVRQAEESELLTCHSAEYLELARREIEAGEASLSTGDTSICRASWGAAAAAAGGVVSAVDAVMSGEVQNAFCAVRPPGHHASTARGMGFCILNNLAIAVRHAQRRHGVGKVLIVDWDVHHGNGTQAIFDEDPSVLFFDTHQHPWYPGTGLADERGRGSARGTKINCPLPAGSGRKEIFEEFERQLLPAAARFKPEMVFVSAGFDSRKDDPLGKFLLTDNDFADLTQIVMTIAAEYTQGRMMSVLEGGYNVRGLESAVRSHVRALVQLSA